MPLGSMEKIRCKFGDLRLGLRVKKNFGAKIWREESEIKIRPQGIFYSGGTNFTGRN